MHDKEHVLIRIYLRVLIHPSQQPAAVSIILSVPDPRATAVVVLCLCVRNIYSFFRAMMVLENITIVLAIDIDCYVDITLLIM